MDTCLPGNAGLQRLLPVLLSCQRLQVLRLSYNNLTMAHMGAVGDVFSRNCQSLQVVDLDGNPKVEDEGLSKTDCSDYNSRKF